MQSRDSRNAYQDRNVINSNLENITKEELKSFNFEKELDRLKKTLSDIKDQESRFIKLLGFKQAKMSIIGAHKNQPGGDFDFTIDHTESGMKEMDDQVNNLTPSSTISKEISKFSPRFDQKPSDEVVIHTENTKTPPHHKLDETKGNEEDVILFMKHLIVFEIMHFIAYE